MRLWGVVPTNQKDIALDFKVLATSGNTGVANWRMTRTLVPSGKRQRVDGIFLVTLENNGLCSLFKQWRVTEEINDRVFTKNN